MAVGSLAQVQHGYVKTKGRLTDNGVVVKGKGLSGALVTIKGRNGVISRGDGSFSLSITGNFYLLNVMKHGYVLTDPEAISREYSYSQNPLVLVLEDEKQFREDKQVAKDKIREALFQQYRQQNVELKRKLAENEIKRDEYDKMKYRLDSLQDSNESLIRSMAEEYARIDFDYINEFMACVQQHILSGELTKADSLLKIQSRNLDEDVNSFIEFKNRNVQKRDEQKWRDSVEWHQKDFLAQQCYAKHILFKMKHLNDSARHYLELRAKLDTANVAWQLEAGAFIENFCIDKENTIWISPDYNYAMSFYLRALRNAINQYGENSPIVGRCYSHIGDIWQDMPNKYYEMALSVIQSHYGEESLEAAEIWHKMGEYYTSWKPDTWGMFEEADSCFKKAIKIYDKHYGRNNLESLLCYLMLESKEKYVKKITRLLEDWGADKQLEKIRILNIIAKYFSFEADRAERAHADVYYYFSSEWVDDNYNYMFDNYDKETWEQCKEAYTKMIEHDKEIIECYENSIDYYKEQIVLMTAIYGEDYVPDQVAKQMIEFAKEQMEYYQAEMKVAEYNLEIGEQYKTKK